MARTLIRLVRRLPGLRWALPLGLLLLPIPPALAFVGGELELQVRDEATGKPVPARLHLKDQRGRPVLPPGLIAWKDHVIVPGRAVLDLRAGTYTFELERGPEYRIQSGHFTIKAGDADNKQVTIERFVDLKKDGWWSGDLHIRRLPKEIELLMSAEDLHVAPVVTWTNSSSLWTGKETPKQPLIRFDTDRQYHLLAGQDERGGGSLLLLNLPQPLEFGECEQEFPSLCETLKRTRQHPGAHVDVEKPASWDLPVWIASGMIDTVEMAPGQLQRGALPTEKPGVKPRNKDGYPDPHGEGHWAQAIYYHLLNCGLRIPPSAGSGSGVWANPVGYNRVYVHCGASLDYAKWWENLRAGQVIVTNGPMINHPRFNGELPGHVFEAAEGEKVELQATFELSVREPVDYLEIIKDGQVVRDIRLADWAKSNGQLPPIEFRESGWMLVRVVASNPQTFRFASTGPVYVEIGGKKRISKKSAQFFLDWVFERARRLQLDDEKQRVSVLKYHRAARDYWQKTVAAANAD